MPALLYFSTDYPFSNRAAVYGDGCFTTMAVENGTAELLSRHISRLQQASDELQLSLDSEDWKALQSRIQATASSLQKGIIKVVISAGLGGRGYLRAKDSEPLCYLQTLAPVSHYDTWRQCGVSLGVSPRRLAQQPDLSGAKHLNRLEQVLVKQQRSSCDDDIVLDREDVIVEVSAGNLFWNSYGRWFTPELNLSGVEGVMRNLIVGCLEAESHKVNLVRSQLTALQPATDVFICNSLMKVVPVNKLVLPDQTIWSFDNIHVSQVAESVLNAIKVES